MSLPTKTASSQKKAMFFGAAVILILGVAFVIMWAMHEIEVDNVLSSRTVDVEINEVYDDLEVDPGQEVTKKVSFENTGTDAVFLRFTYAQYWETDDELLIGYTDGVALNWVDESFWDDWYVCEDGWYYYEYVLDAEESVNILSSVTFPGNIPSDAYYNLIFQVETIQVSDEDGVNTAATQELFGLTGILGDDVVISNGAVTSASVGWSVISNG